MGHRPGARNRGAGKPPPTKASSNWTVGVQRGRSGFSNTPAWVAATAQTTIILNRWTPPVALQYEYSLLARTIEGEITPFALDQRLALVPWSPLKNGYLSGKYHRDTTTVDSARVNRVGQPDEEQFAVIDVVNEVAEQINTPPSAVALAWLRA